MYYRVNKIQWLRLYSQNKESWIGRIFELAEKRKKSPSDTPVSETERKQNDIEFIKILKTLQGKQVLEGLSEWERKKLDKILFEFTHVIESSEWELSQLSKEISLTDQRDILLSLVPKGWNKEHDILSQIHHTNIRSLLSLLKLPKKERENIIQEFGTNETGESMWGIQWNTSLKSNRKVLRMIEDAWYRSDGFFWSLEAEIIWRFLSLTLDENARIRPILQEFTLDMEYGLTPEITKKRIQSKDELSTYNIFQSLSDLPISYSLRKALEEELGSLEKEWGYFEEFWKRLGYVWVKNKESLLEAYKKDPLLKGRLNEVLTIWLNAQYSIHDILRWTIHSKDRLWSFAVLDTLLKNTLETISKSTSYEWNTFVRTMLKWIGEESMMRNIPQFQWKFRILAESLYIQLSNTPITWSQHNLWNLLEKSHLTAFNMNIKWECIYRLYNKVCSEYGKKWGGVWDTILRKCILNVNRKYSMIFYHFMKEYQVLWKRYKNSLYQTTNLNRWMKQCSCWCLDEPCSYDQICVIRLWIMHEWKVNSSK
jgi:hypothetical protein